MIKTNEQIANLSDDEYNAYIRRLKKHLPDSEFEKTYTEHENYKKTDAYKNNNMRKVKSVSNVVLIIISTVLFFPLVLLFGLIGGFIIWLIATFFIMIFVSSILNIK